jgi:hypothetical protein
MKHIYILTFLFCSFYATAQDKIIFTYDEAGNQTKRELCINCATPNARYAAKAEEVKQEELTPVDASSPGSISYYPNPVQQELYLSWQIANNNTMATIQIFDLNGRMLDSFSGLETTNLKTVSFNNYPDGLYLVSLTRWV